MEAQASAEGIRAVGQAEATALAARGAAEAEGLEAMSSAFGEFGEAAKLSVYLKALPALAAEVAAPLARTGEIVIIGEGDKAGKASTNIDAFLAQASALVGHPLTVASVVAACQNAAGGDSGATPTAV